MTIRTALRRTAAAAAAAALATGALLAAPAAAAPAPTPAPAAVTPPITVLATGMPDKPFSDPTAVNNADVVVGYAWADGQSNQTSAIRWNPDHQPTTLPPLPGEDYARALGVNDAGTAIGTSWPAPRAYSTATAVRWAADGTPTALPPLPGDTHSNPTAIGGSGIVVGASTDATGKSHAVAWHPDGTTVALAPLPGDDNAVPYDVNSTGVAVGQSYTWTGLRHGTVWNPDGTATAFVTDPAAAASSADRINDAGAVAGRVSLPEPGIGSVWHGLLRSADGTLHDLGPRTYPGAINSSGATVGDHQPDPDLPRTYAARWSPDGTLTRLELDRPTVGRTTAADINDSGTVAGYAWDGIPSRQYQSGKVWAPDNTVTDLDPADTTNSARFVNNTGLVVGVRMLRPPGSLYPYRQAAVWRP
ncbi:hypothetical protein [Kitasatospora sp. NPDC058046]|uniref:hypothetical protein n=1 Tax=Kitasatospora sp. NPDC058046 TaxID=3346312 RepID=UPI0036D7818A